MGSHYDLAVIGTGSGNIVVDRRFADRSVAFLERGVFGGTCSNVGCIPTKMFVYPADIAREAQDDGPRLGVATASGGADWPAIRDRIFGRIDPMSASGRDYRVNGANTTLYEGQCRFVGERTLDTGTGETITADQIVIASGSRAVVPPIEGLADVPFHTSDTIMRLKALPRRLAIIGGGFISAEFAHIFSSFGTEVTVVVRSDAMLRTQDEDLSRRFTELAARQWRLRLNTEATRVETIDGAIRLHLNDGVLDVDVLLVATGRRSNGDLLDLDRAGVAVDDADVVLVDEFQRTSAPGVWALGDVANYFQLKHVANHEARIIQHNLLFPDALVPSSHVAVPRAVFSHPQVATVGSTEAQARSSGLRYVTATQEYGDTAYGWAMEDTTGIAKVIADPETGLLLGAHIVGHQASNLIQPLIQAMAFGQTARDVAREQYWIHPALMEVTENVLLAVDKARR
ncbi:MAG: mycothione reductase [Nocardioidaceae bacterium]